MIRLLFWLFCAFFLCLGFFSLRDSFLPAILTFALLALRDRKIQKAEILKQQKHQFCDALMTMSGLLLTGMPLEKVFSETSESQKHLYGQESFMAQEFARMDAKIRMNRTGEQVLFEFAEKSPIPEAAELAQLVSYVRRNNGKVEEVCGNLAYQMGKAFETESEIDKIMSAGRTELKLMRILPPVILLLLKITEPELLRPLYTNLSGRLFTAVCFGVYFLIWIVTDRMMES